MFSYVVAVSGFDLAKFGILTILVTTIVVITSQVGMNVHVLKAALTAVPMLRIVRGLVPVIDADFERPSLLAALPAKTLWPDRHL